MHFSFSTLQEHFFVEHFPSHLQLRAVPVLILGGVGSTPQNVVGRGRGSSEKRRREGEGLKKVEKKML